MKSKADIQLRNIPADVNYDDATMTCWNGEAFVTWEKWRLSVPVQRIDDQSTVAKSESVTSSDAQRRKISVDQENLFSSEDLGDYSE